MELSKLLIKSRHEKGLTQAEAAELAGVSDRSLSSWEIGTTSPKYSNLVNLLNVYEIKIEFIK